MPQTNQLAILSHHKLQHIITAYLYSRTHIRIVDPVNGSALTHIYNRTIGILPYLWIIFSVHLPFVFKIIKIRYGSRKHSADRRFSFSIKICSENPAVPFSICSFIHISTVKNKIIHNTEALYTIFSRNGCSGSSIRFHRHHHASSLSL